VTVGCDCVGDLQERLESDASVLLPVGGLKMCKNIISMANGRVVVLAGDKVRWWFFYELGALLPDVAPLCSITGL